MTRLAAPESASATTGDQACTGRYDSRPETISVTGPHRQASGPDGCCQGSVSSLLMAGTKYISRTWPSMASVDMRSRMGTPDDGFRQSTQGVTSLPIVAASRPWQILPFTLPSGSTSAIPVSYLLVQMYRTGSGVAAALISAMLGCIQ